MTAGWGSLMRRKLMLRLETTQSLQFTFSTTGALLGATGNKG